jgi:hypothetical protein
MYAHKVHRTLVRPEGFLISRASVTGGKTLAAVGARRSRTPVLVCFPIATHARAPRRRALHPPLPTMSAWGASGAWASQVRSRSGSRPPPSPTAPDATKPCARRLPASGGGASRARDPARPRSPRRARGRQRLGERLEAPREAGAAPRRARSSATARGERVAHASGATVSFSARAVAPTRGGAKREEPTRKMADERDRFFSSPRSPVRV